MDKFFFIIGDYLNGKPVYALLRRAINLLFSLSLASFLFERFYYTYTWIDITDYKSILDFLVKGTFFIPFSIFIVIHYLFDYLSEGILMFFVMKRSSKLIRGLLEYQFDRWDYRDMIELLNDNPVATMPVDINKQNLLEMLKNVEPEISPEQWQELERGVVEKQSSIKENFKLTVKAIVTISVYFFIVPHFGAFLYAISLIILVLLATGQYYGYLLMDILPSAIRRFHIEIVNFVKSSRT